MANISALLEIIRTAHLGRDMRQALHDAIESVNNDTETALGKSLTFTTATRKLSLKAKDGTVLSEAVIPGGGSGGGSVDSVNEIFPDENGNVEVNLNDINDVDITSATDGQLLGYDNASGKWRNVNAPSGGGDIYVTPEEFGAVGDGVTDDFQAISDAFDEAQSTGKTLYFDHKTYACSQTINRNGTLNHNIIMDGVILMTANVDGLIFDKIYSRQLKLSILSATQNTNSGITFSEIDSSNIEIVKIGLFDYGLNLKATGGISYNTFNIGMIFNAEYCLYFNAQSGGWVNENLFLNGRFWKNSAFVGTCRGIYMTNAVYNNNVFIKPSVEGCHLGIKMENGTQNHFYEIRSEGMNGDTINLDSLCTANYFKIGYNDSSCTVTDNGQYLNNTITYASVMQPNFFNIANGSSFRKCYANTNLSLPKGMFVMGNNTEGNTYVYGGVRNAERINYTYPVFSKYNVKSIAGKVITILINTVNKEDIMAHFQFRDSSNNIISTIPRCNTTVTYRDDGYGNNIIGTYTEPYNRAIKIQIPANAVVMYVNLKSISGYSGYSIFTDVDIPITQIINKVSGLTSAPTDTTNCAIGDYCNNVDTNTPTLKGWFFDGSTWQPDYINSTP